MNPRRLRAGTPANAEEEEEEEAASGTGRLVHPSPSMSPELKGLMKEALEALEAASEEETSIVQSWDAARWQVSPLLCARARARLLHHSRSRGIVPKQPLRDRSVRDTEDQ